MDKEKERLLKKVKADLKSLTWIYKEPYEDVSRIWWEEYRNTVRGLPFQSRFSMATTRTKVRIRSPKKTVSPLLKEDKRDFLPSEVQWVKSDYDNKQYWHCCLCKTYLVKASEIKDHMKGVHNIIGRPPKQDSQNNLSPTLDGIRIVQAGDGDYYRCPSCGNGGTWRTGNPLIKQHFESEWSQCRKVVVRGGLMVLLGGKWDKIVEVLKKKRIIGLVETS